MNGKYITIKIWRSTKRRAKILAEKRGITLVKFLDNLVSKEEDKSDDAKKEESKD